MDSPSDYYTSESDPESDEPSQTNYSFQELKHAEQSYPEESETFEELWFYMEDLFRSIVKAWYDLLDRLFFVPQNATVEWTQDVSEEEEEDEEAKFFRHFGIFRSEDG